MATIQYARLYPDTTQLQAKDGHNLTAGWVEVYLAGTDDPATTYADFNGTVNPQKIIVDDNGRFTAIVDKSKAYRVEVYDSEGMLQWTTEPVWCTGNAGAGMSVTRVISTDGSISVDENIAGTERTYDIGIAPADSDEFLEWIKCSEEDCGSTWHPVYQAGTMETEAGQGIKVHAGQLYHFTSTFYVDPNGTGTNYDTFKVTMYCNDEIVDVRDFDIDSSLNDAVMCEFSTDLIPSEDGFVYYKLTIPSTCEVNAEVQCHRIYSGINAVPDTCATKQWVQETFDYNMAEKISYSALEYNGSGYISGISGSAIAGGLDSAAVSAIASSYAESAISSISGWSGDFSSISSKLDASASSMFQPSGDYQTAGDYAYNSALSSKADQSAFEQCCDEVHSALDEKLDKSASSEFQPSGEYVYESAYSSFSSEVTNNISSISSTVSGLTGQYIEQSASSMFQPSGNYASASDLSAYVPFSGLEGEGGKVTGISGSAFKGHEYTGIYPVIVDNVEDTISVEHRTLCVDSTMTAYNSGSSAVIGVNVAGLDISSKMDASASSMFYPTGNPSGFIDGASASAIASAYAESAASSKQDTLTFAYDDDKISAINGSALAGQGGGGGLVTAIGTSESGITSLNNSSLVDTAALRSADYSSLYVQEPLYISASGDSSYIGISGDIGGIGSATCSAIASAYAESAASGKLDSTAQVVTAVGTETNYTPDGGTDVVTSINGNYINALSADSALQASYDEEGRELTSLASEYEVSSIASSYAESAASSKLDTTAFNSGDYYSTSNPSGFITGVNLDGYATTVYVDSAVSSKQDALTFSYDDDKISAINGSALAGGGGASIPFYGHYWDSAESATAVITADVSSVDSVAYKKYNGTFVNTYSGITDTLGNTHFGVASFISPGAEINNQLSNYTLAFAPSVSMWTTSDAATGIFAPLQYGTGAGMFMDNNNFKGYLKGNEMFVCNTSLGQVARVEVHQSRGAHLCLTADKHGIVYGNFSPSGVVLSNGASHVTANLDANTNRGAALRLYGGTGSAVNSQTSMAFLTPEGLKISNTASGTAKYAINSIALYDIAASAQKTISSTSIDYWNGKADSSALSSYASAFSAGEGLEFVQSGDDRVLQVEAPVDIVAGPGIVIDNPDGNTLRVSTNANYETVLWSASEFAQGDTQKTYNLSETPLNFETIKVYACRPIVNGASWIGFTEVPIGWLYNLHSSNTSISMPMSFVSTSNNIIYEGQYFVKNTTSTAWQDGSSTQRKTTETAYTTGYYAHLYKIVGVNRIANN